MGSETELMWVDTNTSGVSYMVGEGEVTRITIAPTGNGLSGYYDVITVYLGDEYEIKMPAHRCTSWCIENKP